MKEGKKRLIHFGDSRYQQYKDKIGYYKHLDIMTKKEETYIIKDMDQVTIGQVRNITVISIYGRQKSFALCKK